MIYSLLPGSDKINFLSCLCQESWIRLADKFCGYNLFMKVLLALLHLNSNLFFGGFVKCKNCPDYGDRLSNKFLLSVLWHPTCFYDNHKRASKSKLILSFLRHLSNMFSSWILQIRNLFRNMKNCFVQMTSFLVIRELMFYLCLGRKKSFFIDF